MLIAEIADRLDQRLRKGGIQLVVAPSGAGKSSLLHAGLVPRIAEGVLSASQDWLLLGAEQGDARVLVVDQLEELFTQCSDPALRRAFLDVLARLDAPPGDGDDVPVAVVVLGVRADFYPACVEDPVLRAELPDQIVVGPLSESTRFTRRQSTLA